MLRRLIIDKFRALSHLELHDLGRVNLLVGTNNCGKTSVLEAIHILVSRGNVEPIYSMMSRRGEQLQAGTARRSQVEVDLCRLFHNYDLESGSMFRITGSTDKHEETLTATIAEYSTSTLHADESGQAMLFNRDSEENVLEYIPPYQLSLVWDGIEYVKEELSVSVRGGLSFEGLRRPQRRNGRQAENLFIPTASLSIGEITSLFEETVLTPEEDLVIECLRIIEPTIERLATVGGADRRYFPSYFGSRGGIMVKCTGVSSRIPIGSLGDGIWRMLGLVLALVRSEGGVVFIDEIDTGLHFTVMADMWKLVADTAKRLNVQVFATTHNSDCWTSLATLARETVSSESEITIQRIERDKQHAVAFTEQEIVIAASRGIEVR